MQNLCSFHEIKEKKKKKSRGGFLGPTSDIWSIAVISLCFRVVQLKMHSSCNWNSNGRGEAEP